MVCNNFHSCLNALNHCPINNSRCLISKDMRSRIRCEENGRKYTLINDTCSTFSKYHVDGQVIIGNVKKCDYMVVNYDNNIHKVIFIELKGQDSTTAADQLYYTIDQLRPFLQNLSNVKYYARMILSKCTLNFRTTPQGRKLLRKLASINNDSKNDKYVISKNNTLEEKISDL